MSPLSYGSINSNIGKGTTANRPASASIGDVYSNTQTGYLEVYTSAGWSQLGVIPQTPTIGTATDVGTNRAFNNGAVSVSFTPNASGGLASSFTVSSTTGGYSAPGSSSPITVTGIPSNTSLTFTATATNGYGNSLASTASNSATATTVPQAPTIGSATNPSGQAYSATASASVAFTAGASGGKTVSNYKYSTDGTNYTTLSPAQSSSPLTISGLTPGSSYSFYLKAVNDNGDSIASSASNSVTVSTVPQAPTIGTVTKVNDTTVSIPFTAPANNGGSAITSYTVTSSPSIALSVSGGTTSPLTVTGSFVANTAYTFTIRAVNANGSSQPSSSSNSLVLFTQYALRETFNTSGTFTVPAGINLISVTGAGAGGGGGGGSGGGNYSTNAAIRVAGSGGGSAPLFSVRDISVTPGQTYTVTIGAPGNGGNGGARTTSFNGPGGSGGGSGNSGGTTSFGNIIIANGGGAGSYSANSNAAGSGGNATVNAGTIMTVSNGVGGGNGHQGTPGNAGSGQGGANSNIANINVINGGGGGGGGGGGAADNVPSNVAGQSPGGGGSSAGGGGGAGGNFSTNNANNGGNGSSANGLAGGGGGGGGGAGAYGSNTANGNGGAGGTGGAARILVYTLG